MNRDEKFSDRTLQSLFDQTPVESISRSDRIVIFSDLHLGNGGRTDDFLSNAGMFAHVLREYYLSGQFQLILNGDIEELQRFRLKDITKRWHGVYRIFGEFEADKRLRRLVGNHDMDLLWRSDHRFKVERALRYEYSGNPIFIFHGHQTMRMFERYNWLVGMSLRFFANPLGVGNYSVAHNSAQRFRTEQRAYDFASSRRILSIMGHTHRPLFESMSKVDTLKFEIERLCRVYPAVTGGEKRKIEQAIGEYKHELALIRERDDVRATVASLYNNNLLIPCTFNSGTVIGKRGMTCLEIENGSLLLVHWFDDERSHKYLEYAESVTERMPGTHFHRMVIKRESMEYIFARIRLLAG